MRKIVLALLLCAVLSGLCSCTSTYTDTPSFLGEGYYAVTVSSSSLAKEKSDAWGMGWN